MEMKKMKIKNSYKEIGILLVTLLMMLVVCLSIWYVRNYYRVEQMTRIKSDAGTFDLTEVDFEQEFARLEGVVSYIPEILTPEDFALRQDEAQSGNPWYESSATSRILLLVPEDKTYTLSTNSNDFAYRVFVNGECRFEVGNPANQEEDFEPGYAQMTIDVKPENGVIEVIQQSANFVHKEGGGHSNLYFGNNQDIQRMLALSFGPEYLIAGFFATLFLIHLILYIVRRSYKPNLIFSMLCFTWMIRSGITGTKIFYAMLPSLSWELAFRCEYVSIPIAAILMVLLIREIFPQIPQQWFVKAMLSVSIVFSILCIFMNTLILSQVLMYYEVVFTLAIIYLLLRFCLKVPHMLKQKQLQIEHVISLVGFLIFMFASINDALYHAGVLHAIGLKISFSATGLAMLIFSFFQMIVMFYGTMRETAQAHERKNRAEAEKEMLSEMNRMKSAFYADLSHEMKTPLTVIAVNAQFAAQNMQLGEVDEETITDLNAISAEAKRLAQMVTSIVGIGRMQGAAGEHAPLSLDSIITETVRIYQTLFARKKNILKAELNNDLPIVEGNADQLIQVLINLLSNANRHTMEGVVCLHAEAIQNGIRVCVSDNGEGINKELLPHVFERYCSGKEGSSGLGLSICKTIVEEHGGKMGIESVEGEGTSVWFTLPMKEDIKDE